jgi:signal transduction histidine kinase
MSAATHRHAFEPFYTTKDRTGTGLGLRNCADVVSRYRGRIATRSNDSSGHSGSVFRVFLLSELLPDKYNVSRRA